MRAEQFIKDHGLERAREVVKKQPVLNASHYRGRDNKYSSSFKPSIEIVYVADLKSFVESVDRVNQRGGYSKTKDHLDYLISYGSEFGHVSKEEVSELTADLKNYESIYGEGND